MGENIVLLLKNSGWFFFLCLAEVSHIHISAVAEQLLELNREVLRMVAVVIVIRKSHVRFGELRVGERNGREAFQNILS